MENNQRVQRLPEIGTPAPESKIVKSKRNKALGLFLRLIAHYPWLLVVALLGLFAGSAVLAVYSLGNAGRIEQSQSSSITEQPEIEIIEPIVSSPIEKTNPFPLWIAIAIVLSCAGGCLVIFRWLNSSTSPQKNQKRVNRYEERLLAQRRQHQTEPRAPRKTPVFVPPKKTKHIPSTKQKLKATVTILPSQSNSLGIHQEPLADSLDLRKQNPISFVVRK
ncbi:MAG: hypothetical protein IGS39_11195 [Calothrix sp. C42_A2020_038]|nr:hypothetical protein [Calothrix sp. C42_A2020_038]